MAPADRAALLDPMAVGRLVVRGVRGNRPYIFTDGALRALVESRFHLITSAVAALGD